MGTGLISSIQNAPGMCVAAVADIFIEKAESAVRAAGRDDIVVADDDIDAAINAVEAGQATVIRDGLKMPELPVDIVVEVSGVPEIAAQIAYACIAQARTSR